MTSWLHYYASLELLQVTTLYSFLQFSVNEISMAILYSHMLLCHSVVRSVSLSNHQITQTFGVIALTCMEYCALSVCAEQMPIFPAAPFIMTGILVIELLSHCCARAELHGLTGVRFCQRALGRRVTADREQRNNSGTSKSTN